MNLDLKNNVRDVENKLITIALAKAKGRRGVAAKLLNMPLKTLQTKIRIRMEVDECLSNPQ